MSDYYPIQGIPLGPDQPDDAPPVRHEVNEWATDKPETQIQVSLFIRALQAMYNIDYREKLSYFQIAGERLGSRPATIKSCC